MSVIDTLTARIGESFTSDWIEISQERINAFAQTTEDFNFIHLDEARAKTETPFGGTIAHGFLTLSLLSKMVMDALPDLPAGVIPINYGFDKIRFMAPVPSGSRIRGKFTLKDTMNKGPGQYQMVYEMSVEIEGQDKPALFAIWLSRLIVMA